VAQNWHAASAPLVQKQHGSSITVWLAVFCERRHASRSLAEDPADRASARPIIASQKTARHCGHASLVAQNRHAASAPRFYHSLTRYQYKESSKVEGGVYG